jgi:hypothetical protein
METNSAPVVTIIADVRMNAVAPAKKTLAGLIRVERASIRKASLSVSSATNIVPTIIPSEKRSSSAN